MAGSILIAVAAVAGFGFVSVEDAKRLTQPELREMAEFDVRSGFAKVSTSKVWIVDGRYLRWLPAWASFPDFSVPSDTDANVASPAQSPEDMTRLGILSRQCEVEAIRREGVSPQERAFWEPVLGQVETVIARELDDLGRNGTIDPKRQSLYDDEIDTVYDESMKRYAARIGVRYIPFAPEVPIGVTQPELRQMASDYVGSGMVKTTPPVVKVLDERSVTFQPPTAFTPYVERGYSPRINVPNDRTRILMRQCEVEVTRRVRSSPQERAFWEPVLVPVEAVIGQMLAVPNVDGAPDFDRLFRLDREIGTIYEGAIAKYAAQLGRVLIPPSFSSAQAPGSGGPVFFDVVLMTPSGQGAILLAPWLDWRLAGLRGNGADDKIFDNIAPGTTKKLYGIYAYKLKDPSGSVTEVRRKEIPGSGKLTFP